MQHLRTRESISDIASLVGRDQLCSAAISGRKGPFPSGTTNVERILRSSEYHVYQGSPLSIHHEKDIVSSVDDKGRSGGAIVLYLS